MAKPVLEVAAILFFFAFSFTGPVTTNLILYRTCYVILGYNQSNCALLGTNNESSAIANLEKKVQPTANIIGMVNSCIHSLITPFLCFCIGSWSDKNGRKPVLVAGSIGFVTSFIMVLIIAMIPNASPWYFVLPWIPIVVTGGFPSLMSAFLCYITDTTSEEDRGVRMGIFQGFFLMGDLIGSLSSSYVYNAGGYITVYGISVACGITAFLYILFLIPEVVHLQDNELGKSEKTTPFEISLLKQTFKSVFRKRENKKRVLLCCLLVTSGIFFLTTMAGAGLMFLYTREKFEWTLRTYTFFSSFGMLLWIAGNSLGVYVLNKVLRVPEQILILVGFLGLTVNAIICGLAQTGWMLYVAASFNSFGGFVGPMARSLVSKTVEEDEIGKVFSVVSAVESVIGLFSSPLYTYIYNSTLNTSAGIFNFVSAGFCVVGIIFTLIIIFIKKYPGYRTYEVIDDGVDVIN